MCVCVCVCVWVGGGGGGKVDYSRNLNIFESFFSQKYICSIDLYML